jgi:2'-5' RNA ligase
MDIEEFQKFRAFFAIDINDNIRYEAVKLIKFLKKQKNYQDIRWTKTENLHITMRFLGNISNSEYQKITEQISQKIKNIKPFFIHLASLIIFPSIKKPIVIALQPEPLTQLIKLNQLIEKSIINCDIKPETKSFSPHLTLGRIIRRRHTFEPFEIELPKMRLKVYEIILYRSDLTKTGPIHTPLSRIPLKTK